MSDQVSNASNRSRSFANRVIRVKRPTRYDRRIHVLWRVFSEYSETSTVHGIRYLGEKRRHWSERVWWSLTVSISVLMCGWFIYQAWKKWHTSPVIISFAEDATPIASITFPTITICSDSLAKPTELNYTHIQNLLSTNQFQNLNLTTDTMQKMYSLTHFCRIQPSFLGEYMDYRNFTVDRDIVQYLRQMSTKMFNRTHDYCYLAGDQKFNCTSLFTETLTDAGLCYTFNQMSSSDIYNVEQLADDFPKVKRFFAPHLTGSGVKEELNYVTHPYRMVNAGTGLMFSMSVPINRGDSDYMCSNLLEGMIIQIHSAEEVPQFKTNFYHIPFDHDVRIAVRPNLMITSPSLIEHYSQAQRKCIAENEHTLLFFKKYTQKNCHLDTLANETVNKCGCVLFWMPRFNDTKVCTYSMEFLCVKQVSNSINGMPNANIASKCLPVCNSVTYDAEISLSKIEESALRTFVQDGYRFIKVSVLFKDQQYFASLRSELYGMLEFFAACGGILSLFMGISLLSFIEILYFATLRLTCNWHKRILAKKRKIAQINLLNSQN